MRKDIVHCDKCDEHLTEIPNAPFVGTSSKPFTTVKLDTTVGRGRFSYELCDKCLKLLVWWFGERK